jgi:ABC-2 type transport system permease protein
MPALVFFKGNVSIGHILVGYLGLLLLGSASIAIGLFGSAIARSQIVAMIVGAAILTPLVLLWAVARAVDPPLNRYLSALALHHDNFRPFMLGRLDLGAVVFYLVITYFFLLAATKVLEARRWR